jgi:low affinity Fe/Cu permease
MRKQKPQQGLFYKLARNTSEAVGSPIASILAVTVIIVWAITAVGSLI